MKHQSDVAWEKWGQVDPYYGVLADDKFRGENIQQSKREFLDSGEEHIAGVLRKIDHHFGPIRRMRALDFGCGVGRLLLPLSQQFERVAGLDISKSMLQEASRNLSARDIGNVELLVSDDVLSALGDRTFDFVHSYIVLQHIEARRGYQIVSKLLDHLATDGAFFLHMCFGAARSTGRVQLTGARRLVRYVRTKVPFAYVFLNVLRGHPAFRPAMEMNEYDVGTMFELFRGAGFTEVISNVEQHGSWLTVSFCGKRAESGS